MQDKNEFNQIQTCFPNFYFFRNCFCSHSSSFSSFFQFFTISTNFFSWEYNNLAIWTLLRQSHFFNANEVFYSSEFVHQMELKMLFWFILVFRYISATATRPASSSISISIQSWYSTAKNVKQDTFSRLSSLSRVKKEYKVIK